MKLFTTYNGLPSLGEILWITRPVCLTGSSTASQPETLTGQFQAGLSAEFAVWAHVGLVFSVQLVMVG